MRTSSQRYRQKIASLKESADELANGPVQGVHGIGEAEDGFSGFVDVEAFHAALVAQEQRVAGDFERGAA